MNVTIDGKSVEVPDALVEAELQKQGKRSVDDKDYVKKAEQANVVAKMREKLGDKSVEDLLKDFDELKKFQDKSKTDTQLATEANRQLKEELERVKGEAGKIALEVKKRDIRDYFAEAQKALNIKVIPSILEEVMAPFYTREVKPEEKVKYDEDIATALKAASEKQTRELQALGLTSVTSSPSFSGGGSAPDKAAAITGSDADLMKIIKETYASPNKLPFGLPPRK